MTVVRNMQSAFLAGELNPLLNARVDSEAYKYGLEICENYVPVNEGPLVKRPGFEYICPADPSSTWLTSFRFSITQEYVIEWAEEKARFYTNGAQIQTAPGVPYEVTTPYTALQAQDLSTQQSYDRLYLNHPAHPPGSLLRTDAVTFEYGVSTLSNGPFLNDNSDEGITVTVSGALSVGGTVTITASSAIFEAGDVGGQFRIEAKDFSDIKAWDAMSDSISIGEYCRSDGKAYQAMTSGACGNIVPTHDSGAEWDGSRHGRIGDGSSTTFGVQWRYMYDRYGIVEITGYTSPTQVDAIVRRRIANSVQTVPTDLWTFGAFSPRRGYPSIVIHWNGRQVHLKDFEIYACVSGGFGAGKVNFQSLTSSNTPEADLGFRRTLATDDPVIWATADRKLLIGTASRELMVGALNTNEAVSGDNITSEVQSFYGSEMVFPVQVGTSTIFVERGGRRIRAAGYDLASDRYVPNDLTAAARHITKPGLVQLAYQRIPHGLLLANREDGQIVAHPENRGDVKGFTRYVLGGGARALSVVSVVGADGKTDELWALIERDTPTGSVREIWRQTEWRELGDEQQEAFFVDCGTRATAAGGQLHFTGATHLAGQTVVALAGGGVVRNIVVAADGSFDLPKGFAPAEPYTLVVGLPYTARATLLRPDLRTDAGPSHALKQRVMKLALRVLDTFGLRAGAVGRRPEDMIIRPADTPMGDAPPLQSGDFGKGVDDVFDQSGGRVTFLSEDPLPSIVSAAFYKIELDTRDAA